MNHVATKGDFYISTNNALLDIKAIHHFLSEESYWAKGISYQLVEKSITNSFCFGVYYKSKTIGLARLITDKTAFAYLCDVYIDKDYRGQGLAKWLLQTVHNHPDLQGLRRWLLMTRDANNLYANFGWEPICEDQSKRMMQLHHPNVYK